MSVVSVNIDSHHYSLSCDDGQEDRLKAIAGGMDNKAAMIRKALPQIPDNTLLVMVGMLEAEDAYNAKVSKDPNFAESLKKEQELAKQAEALAARIDSLANSLVL